MKRTVKRFSAKKRTEFIASARGFMGATWRHQGRRPDAMDCLGLVVLSLRAVGVEVEDREGYGRTPYNRQLSAALRLHFGEPVVEPQPGDIVTLAWDGEENHVGIVTNHPEGRGLIHCDAYAPGAPKGRVIEHRLSDDWRARIVEAFRP